MLEVCRGWVGDDLSIPVKMTNLTINPIVSYCYGSSYKKIWVCFKNSYVYTVDWGIVS